MTSRGSSRKRPGAAVAPGLLALALTSAPAVAQSDVRTDAAAAAALPPGPAARASGSGTSCRLETPAGPLRVFAPPGYDPRTAGTVAYVHGYHSTLDETWTRDDLPGQFMASRKNALYVAPAAPVSALDPVFFPDLHALLQMAAAGCGLDLPPGPLVVAGHSAAYRTILPWLEDPGVREIVLLDALYGRVNIPVFRRWLSRTRSLSRRLVLLAQETVRESLRLTRTVAGAARRLSLPDTPEGFTRSERRARVLFVRSQYGHDEIVGGGRAIPVLLGSTVLPDLANAPAVVHASR